jgi:hypothetical protein
VTSLARAGRGSPRRGGARAAQGDVSCARSVSLQTQCHAGLAPRSGERHARPDRPLAVGLPVTDVRTLQVLALRGIRSALAHRQQKVIDRTLWPSRAS